MLLTCTCTYPTSGVGAKSIYSIAENPRSYKFIFYIFPRCVTISLLFTATPFTATECTQNGLTAHFGAATLGFLVTFAHKKHLAGYYL